MPLPSTFGVVVRALALQVSSIVANVHNYDEHTLQLKVDKVTGALRDTGGGSMYGGVEVTQISLLLPSVRTLYLSISLSISPLP